MLLDGFGDQTPVDRTVSSIVTTGCLLVVLLDNGPTAPWIRPDLPGRPRRVGGGCATPITSPDKADVSGFDYGSPGEGVAESRMAAAGTSRVTTSSPATW